MVTTAVALFTPSVGDETVMNKEYLELLTGAARADQAKKELEYSRGYMHRFCDELLGDRVFYMYKDTKFTGDDYLFMIRFKCHTAARGQNFYGPKNHLLPWPKKQPYNDQIKRVKKRKGK